MVADVPLEKEWESRAVHRPHEMDGTYTRSTRVEGANLLTVTLTLLFHGFLLHFFNVLVLMLRHLRFCGVRKLARHEAGCVSDSVGRLNLKF